MLQTNMQTQIACNCPQVLKDNEIAFHELLMHFSLLKLSQTARLSYEKAETDLHYCLKLCQTIGLEKSHHYKQLYLYDENNHSLISDWRMSEIGLYIIQKHGTNISKVFKDDDWQQFSQK